MNFTDGEAEVSTVLTKIGRHELAVFVATASPASLVTVDSGVTFNGSGVPEDPYLINNAADLNKIRYLPDAHYRLEADIDLSAFQTGEGWEPIGTANTPFTGSMDGNEKTISNLFINRPDERYQGLFGVTDHAELSRLSIRQADVTGSYDVGGLVGKSEGGSIREVHVSGKVTGYNSVAGLAGPGF